MRDLAISPDVIPFWRIRGRVTGVNVERCISISINNYITPLFRVVEQGHTYRALVLQEKIPALTQIVSELRYHGDRGSEGKNPMFKQYNTSVIPFIFSIPSRSLEIRRKDEVCIQLLQFDIIINYLNILLCHF